MSRSVHFLQPGPSNRKMFSLESIDEYSIDSGLNGSSRIATEMLTLDPNHSVPLVTQIVEGIKELINQRKLRAGTKIPSIRQLAEQEGVSVSTVVEAYDRLVAEGFLVPRQSSGFFVRAMSRGLYREERQSLRNIQFNPLWFVRQIWESSSAEITPGYGWVPDAWLDSDIIRRSLRSLSARPPLQSPGYGLPKGSATLRLKICDLLAEQEIPVAQDQVLLTTGASHAIELVTQYLLRPGDVALVDEPGYSVMVSNLRARGAKIVGVPWTPNGPDLSILERLAMEHKPRAFFTNPRLHNPTGASYSTGCAYRVLQLAERYDFFIVEDDVCADLDVDGHRSLACLDQLNRVIYLTSFSKSISPQLRVGFIAAHPDAIEDITQIKMTTGLTSSEITERLTHEILIEGRQRKHIKALKERLAIAQESTGRRLEETGLEIFTAPRSGLFIWARVPGIEDSAEICYDAIESDILLAPGHLFITREERSPWLRFNVAFSDHPRLFDFLASTIKKAGA